MEGAQTSISPEKGCGRPRRMRRVVSLPLTHMLVKIQGIF